LQQATLDADLGWEKSLIMITGGTIDLLVRHSEIVTTGERFPKLMQRIFEIFNGLLGLESRPVASAVYAGICNLLPVLGSRKDLHDCSASAALELWQAHHPADIATTPTVAASTASEPVRPTEDNQKALTIHAEVLLKLHELFPYQVMSLLDASATMESMRKTIFDCVHAQYTSDVNKPSSEQERLIAMLPILYEKMSTQKNEFVQFLLGFVRAALLDAKPRVENERARPMNQRGRQQPSFVAFSSKCIDILEAVIGKLTVSDSSVVDALCTFSEVIKSKYTSTPQGINPVLWRNATTKAISIIEAWMPASAATTPTASLGKLHPFLAAVVNVAMSILGSGGLQDLEMRPSDAQILSDEEFDMESFKRLHKIASPNMATWYGSSQKMRETCRSYMVLLLHTSFISTPYCGDLPPDLQKAPLDKLLDIRAGTVCPPVSPTRLKIPYVALNTLFDLVSQPKKTTDQRYSLAFAAAPYLLLRCAWAFKTFIADQPLRSLSPLPTALCDDLLQVITMCLQTETFDDAFSRESLFGGRGSGSKDDATLGAGGKRHLRLLYPLVLKFLAVWRRVPRLNGGGDWMEKNEARGIERGLDEWLSVVGRDWELDVEE
jgi:hypothetical protein